MSLNIKDFDVFHFEKIDSTNAIAKRFVESGRDKNTIIIADEQTNGKTTKSTPWTSPKGNLYLTLMIKLNDGDEKFLPQLSFISAISLVEAIQEVIKSKDIDIKIKWPNDLLLNGKKLSGILIERDEDFAIIGIGVNTESSPDASLTRYPATSLKQENFVVNKDELAVELCKKIIENINDCKQNSFSKIIEKIKPFMFRLNSEISISVCGENMVGIFSGIAENGGLILQIDGNKKTLLSGELTKENF